MPSRNLEFDSGVLRGSPRTSVRPPMKLKVWRDLQLLEAVEEQSTITQRTLAARLGIALGLTNLYVKRLIQKGYIKCETLQPRRLAYVITPRGAARKARLALEFMKYSLDLYRDARRRVHRGLDGRLGRRNRVAIYGTGEAAELVFLLLREIGVEPVATFDEAGGQQFLGMPVHRIADHRTVAYDLLIVALIEKTQPVVNALVSTGVPPQKLLLLRQRSAQGKRRRARSVMSIVRTRPSSKR